MVRRILTWAAGHGVTDVVLNLHHHPHTITAIVGDGRDLGVRVRYSWEQPKVLGSAGGPRLALPIVGADTFFLINGDTLTDVNLAQMAEAHQAAAALVTLALVPNTEFMRYGGVAVDTNGVVTGFVKRGPQSEGSWHFIGVQVVSAAAFAPLEPNVAINSIGGVYDDLIRTRPGSVRAFRGDWTFWDVGTPADYVRTSRALSHTPFDAGRRVRVDPSARLDGSILWDDVEVGAAASLVDCIVTDGVSVPARAAYDRAILTTSDDGGVVATPIAL